MQSLSSRIRSIGIEHGADLIGFAKVCRPDKCDYACVNTCPIGALSQNKAQTFTMDDKTYRYGQLDHFKCRWCLDGFTEGSGSRTHFEPPKQFEQADFAKAAAKREIPDKGLFLNSLKAMTTRACEKPDDPGRYLCLDRFFQGNRLSNCVFFSDKTSHPPLLRSTTKNPIDPVNPVKREDNGSETIPDHINE